MTQSISDVSRCMAGIMAAKVSRSPAMALSVLHASDARVRPRCRADGGGRFPFYPDLIFFETHGIGLSDQLTVAAAQKGSLYHHFPSGKADLSLAVATRASDEMLRVIAASFANAETLHNEATTHCFKKEKLLVLIGRQDVCPTSSTLFESPENATFPRHAGRRYQGWTDEVQDHAMRFEKDETCAKRQAVRLFLLIQGGGNWRVPSEVRKLSGACLGCLKYLDVSHAGALAHWSVANR